MERRRFEAPAGGYVGLPLRFFGSILKAGVSSCANLPCSFCFYSFPPVPSHNRGAVREEEEEGEAAAAGLLAAVTPLPAVVLLMAVVLLVAAILLTALAWAAIPAVAPVLVIA